MFIEFFQLGLKGTERVPNGETLFKKNFKS